ncbi:F0F1 ATP synthase subunit epsilon [Marinisporobacter balticus]|uniref:ATP synthase epsilon chain n=1 Tax=Marinisporobacter balticus TaxID=2018667 RepID=A0A4R2KXX6_9FIRM|nr:F0F1 ATP synthase subunit epsilon [Marinisporobacter balticus]TCO78803.1 ATP synthase F1 subcomplex epsilon subunit [Marinisporobacter balticus]
MASTFELEIVTPDKKFYEGSVERIVIRTTNGDIGILKDHMFTVSPLQIGAIKIKQEGKYKEAACAGGFIQVKEEKTTIITDSAEWADEIDIKRAEEAKKRAEERLHKSTEDIDMLRAKAALKRALTRLQVAK